DRAPGRPGGARGGDPQARVGWRAEGADGAGGARAIPGEVHGSALRRAPGGGARPNLRRSRSGEPMRIVNIVGARPNLMKIAPLMEVMGRTAGIEPILVHTGQHYDERMSELFFRELGIPAP